MAPGFAVPDNPLDGIHAYEIDGRPGARLCIGRQPGRVRPSLWVELEGRTGTLAQFHGESEALTMITFLDAMTNQINRVIQFYADQHGDETT